MNIFELLDTYTPDELRGLLDDVDVAIDKTQMEIDKMLTEKEIKNQIRLLLKKIDALEQEQPFDVNQQIDKIDQRIAELEEALILKVTN